MKKIKTVVLILALFMCFNRCERNQPDDVSSANCDELTIEQAKAFVEMQKMGIFSLKSSGSEKQSISIRADWGRAKTSSNANVSVVETDLEAMGGFGFATQASVDVWMSDNSKQQYLSSKSRLVVIRFKKTKEEYSFIMTVIGDKQYLDSKHFRLSDNEYLKRAKDFSGYIFFHSLTGKFVNGWEYRDGQITQSVGQTKDFDAPVNLKSAQYLIPIYSWVKECTEWHYVDNTGCPTILVSCSSRLVIIGYGSVPSGGSGGDTSAGGTSGGYEPSGGLQSTLRIIFVKGTSNLTADDVNTLNTVFDEINADCMLKQITDYLQNNGITMGSISIVSSQIQPARYNGIGDITLGGSWAISSMYLEHEWFHVGQKKMTGISLTNGYAEFEAWLFFDIKETIKVRGDFNATGHEFACYKKDASLGVVQPYKDEYQNWLRKITNNGTTYPTAIPDEFYSFGPKFAATRGYAQLSFGDTSYKPTTMLNLINHCK